MVMYNTLKSNRSSNILNKNSFKKLVLFKIAQYLITKLYVYKKVFQKILQIQKFFLNIIYFKKCEK